MQQDDIQSVSESETLKDYGDWIDGVYSEEFGTSTPKEKVLCTSKEYEDWLDTKYEETFSSLSLNNSDLEKALISKDKEPSKADTKCDFSSDRATGNEDSNTTEDSYLVPEENSNIIQEGCMTPNVPVIENLEEGCRVPSLSNWEPEVSVGDGFKETQESDPLKPRPVEQEPSSENPVRSNELDSFILGTAGSQPIRPNDETTTWEDITICQLRSSSMLRVSVLLQDKPLKAVVDTAAEVTIISDRVFAEMDPKPPCLKKVTLHTAGRDMKMQGFVAGPVNLQLGSSIFPEAVYVAPIQDDMLLGLDFLLRHGVDIKLEELYLSFRERNEKIPIEVEKTSSKESTVARVTIHKTTKIPPNSVVRLQCEITNR
ncbi:MAG: retropepsin-like domain-containing protein, partial [Candidatus Thiodiazotropha taylori]|nr:retropepsin-like domain-containing protein [Candidatus Thiodiazotropha taylori]MCW4309501.1 retropepsin-like domain-containing protein [Candidatus Thiodiazotropha endolucinida]